MLNLLLLILLLLSRLLFVDGSADFFDATQYIRRVQEPFWHSLTSGHPPFHPLYIALGNIFYRTMDLFGIHSAGIAAALPSAVFGSLAVAVFYLFVKKIFNRKIALLSSIFIAIVPFFWIASITVLVDPTGIFFFILAIYLYWLGLESSSNKKGMVFILLAGLSFGLALFTHTSFAMWTPTFFGLFLYKQMRDGFNLKDLLFSLFFVLGPLLIMIAYVFLLVDSGLYSTSGLALKYLLLGNIGDKLPSNILGTVRNLWYESGSALLILALCGFTIMLAKKQKQLILIIFWILPAFIVSSYIYENLHGRAMILAIFALSMLAAYFILGVKQPWPRTALIIMALAITLNISLPAVYTYGSKNAPNETLPDFEKKLPENSLLIGTNTMRTWNDDTYIEKYERMGDVDVGTTTVRQDIKDFIANGRPVYLASDAIVFGYWRYDGQFFDIRSLSLKDKDKNFPAVPLGSELFEDYSYDLALSDPAFKKYILKLTNEQDAAKRIEYSLNNLPPDQNIMLGRVVDADAVGSSPLARGVIQVYSEKFHIIKENVLARDLIYQAYRFIKREGDPLLWTITDSDGFFVIPVSEKVENERLKIINDPYTSRVKEGSSYFVERKIIDVSSLRPEEKEGLDRNELIDEIARLSPGQSFYLKRNRDKNLFDLIIFAYQAPKTKRIEAEDLANRTGQIVNEINASGGKIRQTRMGPDVGFVTCGPYITLPSGKYRLSAKVKINNINSDANDFGAIEAAGTFDNINFGKKKFTKDDLETFKNYNITSFEFELKNETPNIELRAFATGHANLYIDYFELEKIN